MLATVALTTTAALPADAAPGKAPKRGPSIMVGLMDDAMFSNRTDEAFTGVEDLVPAVIRFSVDWKVVARRKPSSARNPNDSAYDFAKSDDVIKRATALGIPVLVTIAHTPAWAGGGSRGNRAPRHMIDLESFSYAVGVRYSGKFRDTEGNLLPRVTRYTAWNEPNTSGHLTPQWVRKGGKWVTASPATYVSLLKAIYKGVKAGAKSRGVSVKVAGGVTKPVGGGPTASEPSIAPLRFIREIAALGAVMDVYAHHPYKFDKLGKTRGDNAAIDNLPALIKTLDTSFKRKKYRVWLTEYGAQTNPPDRFLGVTPSKQAAFVRQGITAARATGRVDMLIWFLLYDEDIDGRAFAGGFQTGLAFVDGEKKPAWNTFRALAGG